MKALTIYQPWASLIMMGAKPFEFRGWDYTTRQPGLMGQRIVIHASTRPIQSAEIHDMLMAIEADESSLVEAIARPLLIRLRDAYKGKGVLEMSAGLGTAILGKPMSTTEMYKGTKYADSDRLDHSKFGWPLTDVQPFKAPVLIKGAQGFWNWPYKDTA